MISLNLLAQKKYAISEDVKNGSVVFKGPVTFNDLDTEPSFTWLKTGVEEYKPDNRKLKYLRSHLKEYSIIIFLGTWCSDSHDMIPKLLKILKQVDYPLSGVEMYGVERDKATRNEENKRYQITLLPTIILMKDDKEVGRITETVKRSVEADLVKIIRH